MVVSVVLLITGMGFAPFSAAVANYLGVFGIGLALSAPVLIAPPRLAAYYLIGTTRGRLEGLLAMRAENHFLLALFRSPGGHTDRQHSADIESAIEFLPRPRQWGSGPAPLAPVELCSLPPY